MEEVEGKSKDEIETYKKTLLIQKCLQQVKERGKMYEDRRHSPQRYKSIKSVVRGNLRSQQKSRNKSSQSAMTQEKVTVEVKTTLVNGVPVKERRSVHTMHEKRGSTQRVHSASAHKELTLCASTKRPVVKVEEVNKKGEFDISFKELQTVKKKGLNEKSKKRLGDRDNLIREQEMALEGLSGELQGSRERRQLNFSLRQENKDKSKESSHRGSHKGSPKGSPKRSSKGSPKGSPKHRSHSRSSSHEEHKTKEVKAKKAHGTLKGKANIDVKLP